MVKAKTKEGLEIEMTYIGFFFCFVRKDPHKQKLSLAIRFF